MRRIIAIVLFLVASSAIAQHIEQAPEPFADPQLVDRYTLNFPELAGDVDSVLGAVLPHKALIEAVYVVADSAVQHVDSVRVRLRESRAVLYSTGNIADGGGGALAPGRISVATPLAATGETGDQIVIHLARGEEAPAGRLRIHIIWRRLF